MPLVRELPPKGDATCRYMPFPAVNRRYMPLQVLPAIGGVDPVVDDIQDIPRVLRQIKEDWNTPEESLNRLTAFTLSSKLRARMRSHHDGGHDGSLDVLVAGCEVCLLV